EFPLGRPREFAEIVARDGGVGRVRSWGVGGGGGGGVVAGEWAAYRRDPNINEFFLPRRIRDSAGVTMFGPRGELLAYVNVARDRRGTRLMGDTGLALLRVLRPAFHAGVHARLRFVAQQIDLVRI